MKLENKVAIVTGGGKGIGAEICFRLADYFDLQLRFVIFLFQTTICFTYILLLYCFIRLTFPICIQDVHYILSKVIILNNS